MITTTINEQTANIQDQFETVDFEIPVFIKTSEPIFKKDATDPFKFKAERNFKMIVSPEIIDTQDDLIKIEAVQEAVDTWINKRRGTVIDAHSNFPCGYATNWQPTDYLTHKAVLVDGTIFDVGYSNDDDVWKAIQSGEYADNSIGGKIKAGLRKYKGDKGYNEISKIELYETSVLPRGANPFANLLKERKITKSDVSYQIYKNLEKMLEQLTEHDNRFKKKVSQMVKKDEKESVSTTDSDKKVTKEQKVIKEEDKKPDSDKKPDDKKPESNSADDKKPADEKEKMEDNKPEHMMDDKKPDEEESEEDKKKKKIKAAESTTTIVDNPTGSINPDLSQQNESIEPTSTNVSKEFGGYNPNNNESNDLGGSSPFGGMGIEPLTTATTVTNQMQQSVTQAQIPIPNNAELTKQNIKPEQIFTTKPNSLTNASTSPGTQAITFSITASPEYQALEKKIKELEQNTLTISKTLIEKIEDLMKTNTELAEKLDKQIKEQPKEPEVKKGFEVRPLSNSPSFGFGPERTFVRKETIQPFSFKSNPYESDQDLETMKSKLTPDFFDNLNRTQGTNQSWETVNAMVKEMQNKQLQAQQ
jgi:hypothetical protein